MCQSLLNHTVTQDCETNGGELHSGSNKQVSKVTGKISEAETNVLIMRLPG